MTTLAIIIICSVGFVAAFAGTILALIGMKEARPMALVGAAVLAVGIIVYAMAETEASAEMLTSLPACERGTLSQMVPPTHVITVEDVRIARSACETVAERLARRAIQNRALAAAVDESAVR